MDEDLRDRFEAYLREQADRAFGDVQKVSGQTLQPFSFASMQAADNLLAKAMRWWRSDRGRALGYVERMAALPFDAHEEHFPAAAAAELHLFELLTDAAEVDDDGAWLEAAAVALAGARDTARFVLRDVLLVIDQDWEIADEDRHRLRALVKPIPPHPEFRDMWDLTREELRDAVVAVLDVCVAYEDALGEAGERT